MWESMGPITDRTKERVGASDFAVVEFRRLMVDAARQFQRDGTVLGRTEPHIPHVKIASFEGIVAKSVDWRTLGIATEEQIIAAE
jgi:phthalate 4,5-dioxygenase oxygenase subunit